MHPLEKFRFCPSCGSRQFVENDFKSKRCEECGFVYYANPCAATAALIVNEHNELLAVRRAKEPARGTLDLPGGFCDMDETVEQGMIRELREETGLHVRPEQISYLYSSPNVYQYSGMGIHTLDMDFLIRIDSHTPLHASDDAAECLWIPLNEVNPDDFGLDSIRLGIRKLLSEC